MSTNVAHEFIDPEGKAQIKVILVRHLRPIYDREREKYDQSKQFAAGPKVSFAARLGEECCCDIRTIERMMSCDNKRLPTVYNLWMLYEALGVSIEEQQAIQNEVTNFVTAYIKDI